MHTKQSYLCLYFIWLSKRSPARELEILWKSLKLPVWSFAKAGLKLVASVATCPRNNYKFDIGEIYKRNREDDKATMALGVFMGT